MIGRINAQRMMDAIVRQSMALVAQLSTIDGVRSPLSHITDEVFVSLVRQLESQGLGKKVIADMFGLALRSYRQKVQRLSECASSRRVTVWGALYGFLAERDSATRVEILEHFRHDDETMVRSILNDLVESGLVCRSGRGNDARYRAATTEELEDLGTSLVVSSEQANDGWEAALIDHHRAVVAALTAKVAGGREASPEEEIGGTTLSYDLWAGHPKEREVREFLATTRERMIALRDEVEAYNRVHRCEGTSTVTFYCGQSFVEGDDFNWSL
jgi:hypothetical protein